MDFIDIITAVGAVIVAIAALCYPINRNDDNQDKHNQD